MYGLLTRSDWSIGSDSKHRLPRPDFPDHVSPPTTDLNRPAGVTGRRAAWPTWRRGGFGSLSLRSFDASNRLAGQRIPLHTRPGVPICLLHLPPSPADSDRCGPRRVATLALPRRSARPILQRCSPSAAFSATRQNLTPPPRPARSTLPCPYAQRHQGRPAPLYAARRYCFMSALGPGAFGAAVRGVCLQGVCGCARARRGQAPRPWRAPPSGRAP